MEAPGPGDATVPPRSLWAPAAALTQLFSSPTTLEIPEVDGP